MKCENPQCGRDDNLIMTVDIIQREIYRYVPTSQVWYFVGDEEYVESERVECNMLRYECQICKCAWTAQAEYVVITQTEYEQLKGTDNA